jgi:hypothetical protein
MRTAATRAWCLAPVDQTHGTSLMRLFLHKWLQGKELRQTASDWRKLMQQLALGQIRFLKLLPCVDQTDARNAEIHGILFMRLRLGVTRPIQSPGQPSCQEGESLGKSMIVKLFRCGFLAPPPGPCGTSGFRRGTDFAKDQPRIPTESLRNIRQFRIEIPPVDGC